MNRVKLRSHVDCGAQRLRFSGRSMELTAADKMWVQMQLNRHESKIQPFLFLSLFPRLLVLTNEQGANKTEQISPMLF